MDSDDDVEVIHSATQPGKDWIPIAAYLSEKKKRAEVRIWDLEARTAKLEARRRGK